MQLRLEKIEGLKISDLPARLLTGIVLVSIIVGNTFFGSLTFILLFYIINLTGLFEFYRLFRGTPYYNGILPGFFISTVLIIAIVLSLLKILDWWLIVFLLPAIQLVYIYELYLKKPEPFISLSLTLMGVIYVSFPVSCILSLPFVASDTNSYSPVFLVAYFSLVWVFDSSAYFTGKLFGRNKLFVRISPNKTWEGLIGASVIVIALAYIYNFHLGLQKINWIVVALVIIVFGTFGDLVKSMLKRSRHVKDSGTILPGHGGILDRFDSMFSSAPFILIYLLISYK